MAIKGKRKPKGRPSSARRRPAAPARPMTPASQRVPWYRTMSGQLTIIAVVLAVIGGVMWWASYSSGEAKELEARQDELETYSNAVEQLVTSVNQPVREMLGAPFNTANKEAIVALKDQTKGWFETIEQAGAQAQTLVPPEGLQASAQVIQQAFLLYSSAAKTYRLVPGEDGKVRQGKLIERATEQRDAAGRVLIAGLGFLDDERDEAELGPAGIQAPSTLTPILPTPSPSTIDRDKATSKGGDGGRGKGGGNGRNERGDKSKNDG